jgi:hypothetical protein
MPLGGIRLLYERRSLQSGPAQNKRGVNLISDARPFGRLWHGERNAISNAVDYVKFRRHSHDAVIRVYDVAGNVIKTHEHAANSKKHGAPEPSIDVAARFSRSR